MKLRAMGKKADLSLSINAIVILILAITMLGLGLAFLRGTFKKTTEQFAEVSGTVKEQIVDEIKSKGEKLFVRGAPELDVKKGETKEVFYGIKNVLESTRVFTIAASCTESIGNVCTATAGTLPACSSIVALETLATRSVSSGDFAVLPLRIKITPDAPVDTYSCFMSLTYAAATGETCPTGGCQYARSDFFIKISP
jgi:hypothetical protein